jgi:NADH-quinone oxidoreductase subunit C
MMKKPEEILEYLKQKFGEDQLTLERGDIGESWIQVPASMIRDISKVLRDDSELQFDMLMCLSGLHYLKEEELGVVYHLHSTKLDHYVTLKVRVSTEQPEIPSVESIWKTADWHEREAWDMVGVKFEGHPNHKRILLPDDWEGHPLRKDYVQQEFYQGIPTGE